MRIIVATAFLWCALPAVSQEQSSSSHILQQALHALPQHIRVLQHEALPNGDDMHQYAIAKTTVGGAEQGFGESAAKLHGAALAEELLASYREVTRAASRIDVADVNGMPVLALDEFATGSATYDWDRLLQKHPNVKAVLRVSQPATAGGYALVRFEMISPAGALWGNFMGLDRQLDGSWKGTRAVAGSMWE